MGHRFSLDRQSFEQFLAAASFLQQVQKHAVSNGAGGFQYAQPLLELVETQQAIETGKLGLEAALGRIVTLAMKVVGASGTAAWLFTRNEFVFYAGAGNASRHDDRLRLDVLTKLAATCQFHSDSPLTADSDQSSRTGNAGYYPGGVKSLLVSPIYQGTDVAGALAACSPELDAFTDRDAANLRLLSGLVAHALAKTAEAGRKQSVALERAAILRVIGKITPDLQQLVENEQQLRRLAPRPFTPQNVPEPPLQASEPLPDSIAEQSLPEFATSDRFTSPNIVQSSSTTSGWELGESETPSENEAPLADISLPFVGVRAALDSDVEEQSHFFANIAGTFARGKNYMVAGFASFFRGLADELSGIVEGTRAAGRRVRSALTFHPKLPRLPQWNLQRHVIHARSSVSRRITVAGAQFREFATHTPKLPALRTGRIRARWLAIQLAMTGATEVARVRVRSTLRHRPTLPSFTMSYPALPKAAFRRYVSRCRSGLLVAASQVRAELACIGHYQLGSRNVRRAAPAAAVLAVMLAFLIFETGIYHPFQTASASARNVSQASLVSHSQKAPIFAAPVARPTHAQITDPEVSAEVQELSRYEVPGIRRLASSGDDYAEFELGMLYETGHGLPQNCSKAAEWVARSAAQGNAAAEYNLGLRYRDGDGVPVNSGEAEKWLHKAAERKYSRAQLALASLR